MAGARAGGAIVPVTRQVLLDGDTPVTAFAKLHRGPFGFLLESLEGGERWARYTFLATDPREVFRYRGRRCERWTAGHRLAARGRRHRAARAPRPHDAAPCPGRSARACPASPAAPWAILGYDVVRTIEALPSRAARRPRSARRHPDGGRHAARPRQPVQPRDRHRERRGARRARTERRSARLYEAAEGGSTTGSARLAGTQRAAAAPDGRRFRSRRATSPYADSRFERDVARIKEYIAAGDTFQTVLSRRIDLARAAIRS